MELTSIIPTLLVIHPFELHVKLFLFSYGRRSDPCASPKLKTAQENAPFAPSEGG
jgi:hypothetical protein